MKATFEEVCEFCNLPWEVHPARCFQVEDCNITDPHCHEISKVKAPARFLKVVTK